MVIGFLRVQETAPAGETAEAANLVGLLLEGPAGGSIREQRRDAGVRQWFLSRCKGTHLTQCRFFPSAIVLLEAGNWKWLTGAAVFRSTSGPT
jgi:hypothetical protein